jgi:Cu/Ag efflux protein CusF
MDQIPGGAPRKRRAAAILIGCTLATPAAFAVGDTVTYRAALASSEASAAMVDGLVKNVDKAAGKVTLSHAPLTNLGMPAMTMVFRVKNASWLDQMKEGRKIRFVADIVNGTYTVVRFEPSR